MRVDLLPETRAFLRDWLEWVERGAPQGDPYNRREGLCIAHYDYSKDFSERWWRFHLDLKEGLGEKQCPFGIEAYKEHSMASTQHLDPKRLAWVRANV